MTLEQFAEFNAYHARNRERAEELRRFVVLCVGVGAMGSYTAALLAQTGCSLVLFDRDWLDEANLTRHYVADRSAVGQAKAQALAAKLRREVPALQSIRAVKGDAERLSDEELRSLLSGASLVLASSGRDVVDHRLNLACRHLRLPLVVPSLWSDNQSGVLGDVHVVTWHDAGRRGACFECLRRRSVDAPAPAEAQRGAAAEVVRLASHTAEVILGLLLTDSPQHAALWRQFNRGAVYFIAPRWPPSFRSVITRPRRGCPACSTAVRSGRRELEVEPVHMSWQDFFVGSALASTVLWHQVVPGLDAAATIAFIGIAGLWWRGRLPSYADVAARVRRWWRGRE